MSILGLLVILCLIGFAAWLVNTKLPLVGWLKVLINTVLFIIAVLLCLNAFGILDEARNTKVPKL